MTIDNFDVIEKFMFFDDSCYYKFELLVRNTDGNNPLYMEGFSKTNKNILIKSWYVDSWDYYNRIKHEMTTLADLTGARLYMCLDKKSTRKTLVNLLDRFNSTVRSLLFGDTCSIKTLNKSFTSETSKVEASVPFTKTIMFDVDTKEQDILNSVVSYINECTSVKPYVLNTVKGYHVFCLKKFDTKDLISKIVGHHFKDTVFEDTDAEMDFKASYHSKLDTFVQMKPNELGLVYKS